METESKNGSTVYGIYFMGQELKHGKDVILMLQLTCLFCEVNKNIKDALIKMKTIFLWLCMSVDNETVYLNFRL